jgi:hypothetical protein
LCDFSFGDPTGQAKVLNSVLISYSIQDASEAAVNGVQTRTANSTVQILLQHVKVAKGPREAAIRRRLHPGEESTAVLGSARCVFWNTRLGYEQHTCSGQYTQHASYKVHTQLSSIMNTVLAFQSTLTRKIIVPNADSFFSSSLLPHLGACSRFGA